MKSFSGQSEEDQFQLLCLTQRRKEDRSTVFRETTVTRTGMRMLIAIVAVRLRVKRLGCCISCIAGNVRSRR